MHKGQAGQDECVLDAMQFDPAINYLCWRGIPIQDVRCAMHLHETPRALDRLIATCMYLESKGIVPDVTSLDIFRKSIDFALLEPTSRKWLFFFQYTGKPHALIFSLERENTGDVLSDILKIQKQVDHYRGIVDGCIDRYVDCIICTQESFDSARQAIGLHCLSLIMTDEDLNNPEKAGALDEIHNLLGARINPVQLPRRQDLEDKLIGPYLYQYVVLRARSGIKRQQKTHIQASEVLT